MVEAFGEPRAGSGCFTSGAMPRTLRRPRSPAARPHKSCEADALATKTTRVDWPSVAVFYVLACAVSWPFFWWRDMHPASWQAWRFPAVFKTSSYMWGPGLAALAVLGLRQFRHTRTITFFGRSRLWSLSFFMLPLITLAMVYAPFVGIRVAVVGLVLL